MALRFTGPRLGHSEMLDGHGATPQLNPAPHTVVQSALLQDHRRLLLRGEAAMGLTALRKRLEALGAAVQDGADISSA